MIQNSYKKVLSRFVLKSLALALVASGSTSLLSSAAQAASTPAPLQDVYRYQIDGSFPLRESCTVDGKKALSTIKVYVDPNEVSELQLVDAYVKVRVCTFGGGQVKQALPLILPIQSLHENLKAPVGTLAAQPFSSPSMNQYFENGTAPDTFLLKRITGSDRSLVWYELTLVQSKTGKVRVGPVRIGMTDASRLSKVSGFNPDVHLPIRKLEIDVPENSITLRAELRKVDQERN